MPHLDQKAATDLIARRHPEWFEHQSHWRFLYDSLEGGNRYQRADYHYDPAAPQNIQSGALPWTAWYTGTQGLDPATGQPNPFYYGQIVDRNLIPHISEMGTEGRALYAMRLARTPVPGLIERGIGVHISKIFGQNVKRVGNDDLTTWWADVDGKGTSMDRWVQETAGPLLLVLGQIDVYFDRPRLPSGATVKNKADEIRLGLNACVVSVALPENILWWELDSRGARYEQVLMIEREGETTWFRHITETDSNAYTVRGEWLPAESREHDYGRVPMVRVFDRRKPRCSHVGKSRYEAAAQLQRSVYNRKSELVLSDVVQSHATLMVPESLISNDGSLSVGPGNTYPIVSDNQGNVLKAEYLDPPKGAQEAVRTHIQDDLDEIDRIFGLAKPPGMAGGTTTAQSGVSKIMDSVDGNSLLSADSSAMETLELQCCPLVLTVLNNAPPEPKMLAEIKVEYPRKFELYTAADLSQAMTDIQTIAQGAGALPMLQGELLNRLVAVLLPGIDDDQQSVFKDEIDTFFAAASEPDPEPDSEPGANQSAINAVGAAIETDSAQGISVPA